MRSIHLPFFSIYFFVFFSRSVAILDPVDYLVLQSIRKSLSDLPGSAFFSGWDFTGDPCATFPGVLCSGGRVVSLSLGDPRAGSPGLSGRLPATLSRLSALSDLSLVPGRVYGEIPAGLPRLPNLRFLALSSNLLAGPIPPSFSPSLKTVDLSSNRLYGQIPSSLLRLPSLSTLVLSHNRLRGPIPTPVSSPLVHLDLKSNLLSGDIPALPSSLRYLSLSSNRLSGRTDRVLSRLPCLVFLDLSMNRLSGQVPGEVFAFPIVSLQLQRNFFSGFLRPSGPVTEGALVDLSYNRLTGRIPSELAKAGTLYLNSNRFIGEVPAEMVERVVQGRIRLLYLQHNYLTKFGIGPGAAVPASTSICLQDNCMVPPVAMTCPVKAGRRRTRSAAQCGAWSKGR
ncbi:uncharacterized protein [Typha angustifolia]|uniref:uncharacterized protein n=1 Tax=Typha angustifolia TaxID=59011 RepID=UPI003C2F780C